MGSSLRKGSSTNPDFFGSEDFFGSLIRIRFFLPDPDLTFKVINDFRFQTFGFKKVGLDPDEWKIYRALISSYIDAKEQNLWIRMSLDAP